MRVGIDARYVQDHYPGIGRYTFNLIRSLAESADRDALIVFVDERAHNTRYDMAALAHAPNVTSVDVPCGTLDLRQHLLLPRLVRRYELDLFHSPTYAVPLRVGCPVVATMHDLIPLVHPQSLPGWRSHAAYRALVWLAVRTAQHILVDAETTRADLIRLMRARPDRMTVIPLAVDETFRPVAAQDITPNLARLGVRLPYVLYVGINKPHKNLLGLLRAWARLPSSARAGHTLVWAGPEDARYAKERRLMDAPEHAGSVCRLGPVAGGDLPFLYSGATCFVAPSLHEGFGLPVLEAMACGTPVCCADRSALPEVVGDAALTFDPRDEEAIASALARVLADPELRRQLAAKGLARAAQLSWRRTATATLAVYRQLVREA